MDKVSLWSSFDPFLGNKMIFDCKMSDFTDVFVCPCTFQTRFCVCLRTFRKEIVVFRLVGPRFAVRLEIKLDFSLEIFGETVVLCKHQLHPNTILRQLIGIEHIDLTIFHFFGHRSRRQLSPVIGRTHIHARGRRNGGVVSRRHLQKRAYEKYREKIGVWFVVCGGSPLFLVWASALVFC